MQQSKRTVTLYVGLCPEKNRPPYALQNEVTELNLKYSRYSDHTEQSTK